MDPAAQARAIFGAVRFGRLPKSVQKQIIGLVERTQTIDAERVAFLMERERLMRIIRQCKDCHRALDEYKSTSA